MKKRMILLIVLALFMFGCSKEIVVSKFHQGDFARVKLDGRKCAILYVFEYKPVKYIVRVSQSNESTSFLGGDIEKDIYSKECFNEWELEALK